MRNLLTYEQLHESENVHATSRQITAFKGAMEKEAEEYDRDMETEKDGERFARLKLMSRIYHDFLDAVVRKTFGGKAGNVLDAFREQYAKYIYRIRGIDQPDKFPGAFLRIDDVDPITAQVNIRRHP